MLDVDTVVDLDVDYGKEVACAVGTGCGEPCPRPATWLGTMTHTDDGTLCQRQPVCQQHRDELDLVFLIVAPLTCDPRTGLHNRQVQMGWVLL